ncbi:Acetyltransferase (GNAT) family protein [Fictibacillus enclensis]|uniref:Acetyltransferase n=1 Tax=Fictibacillus enclensis TaxID=1017270 RepID=A0A0V8JF10_9BACL|nr:GNAT family N-acetyltransferase [Fictibacillus enclensis]KSU85485.1 acetyltransferase [Fictibacillus enclensis]SCB97600.1 Acetyltransferase (GNAT) family protein [Fictibacillus enclensis]
MKLTYEILPADQAVQCRELCNELMIYQKSKAVIKPELFNTMNFETRMLPSIESALHNHLVAVKDGDEMIGYVYTNVSPKTAYSNDFATFFDLNSVSGDQVGCLSQFYIKDGFRQYGIGSKLFEMSMEWLRQFNQVEDLFIYVSNGNKNALEFYQRKGFVVTHDILGGFITVLRNRKCR